MHNVALQSVSPGAPSVTPMSTAQAAVLTVKLESVRKTLQELRFEVLKIRNSQVNFHQFLWGDLQEFGRSPHVRVNEWKCGHKTFRDCCRKCGAAVIGKAVPPVET